jgi:phospholipase/lecithinase/hemolysin/uncharacterized protein YhjY with autotransporter beta-barrel domain
MNTQSIGRALLGATALALCGLASPAAAQEIDRIVTFGDSYADDGNAFELGLVPPQLFPLYPTRRFTGGTNYIDTLSDILDAPVENFAIGGARANPDFLLEVGAFMSGGGGVFPVVTPSFGEGDLLTVSIGGNDARAYGSTPGASVEGAPAAAAPAIAAATSGLNTLVAAGAPTISFLAGDTGELPEVAGNPAVAAIRSAYSSAFNLGLQNVLAGYAADGVIVHYLDLSDVLGQVGANPAAYGLTGLVCPAFPDPTCIVNSGAGFLIYGDLLHPTSQGSAIIARYVAAQLQAPLTFQATSELALNTAQQFGRTLSSRMDFTGEGDQGMRFFVVGDGFTMKSKGSDSTDAFDQDIVGGTAGVSYAFGNGVAGVAVNLSRPKAGFGNDSARTRSKTLQIGGFANLDFGGAFAQGYAGYGRDDHEIERAGVVDGMEASPDGSHWLAGAKLGYLVPMGELKIGPVAALDYAKAKVDGYTEEGDPALTLDVGSMSARALVGSLGAELQGDLTAGGMKVRPMLELAIEKQLSGNAGGVSFAQTSAPIIVNRWEFEEGSKSAYGRATAGLGADILGGVAIDAQVSMTFRRDDGNETSAQVGLSLGF